MSEPLKEGEIMHNEVSQYPSDKEHLKILLRQFADVLIQIRKDTNRNGEQGLKAIDWMQNQLHNQIENYLSAAILGIEGEQP